MLTIDYSDRFRKSWDRYGFGEFESLQLERELLFSEHWETRHPVVRGTGGVRKCRFAPMGWGRGKRGGFRVYYVRFPEFDRVYVILLSAKNVEQNLPEAAKKDLRKLVDRLKATYAKQRE